MKRHRAWSKIILSVLLPLLILAVIPSLRATAKPNGLALKKNVVIYKKKGVYAAFPNLYKMDGGTLVVSFVTRTTKSHYDAAGGSKTLISQNGGNTWGDPAPGTVYVDPKFKTKGNGYVYPSAVGWKEVPAGSVKKLESGGVEVNESNNKYFAAVGAQVSTSTDGKTWKVTPLDTPRLAMLMNYNSSSQLNAGNGVRLCALYGVAKAGRKDRVFIVRSVDDGKTWQIKPMFPKQPVPGVGFDETALVETKDGNILAMMRSDPPGYLYSSVSKDGGNTWSLPRKTAMWGFPANLLRLKDGRILCSYGYRRAPMGVRASILGSDYVSIEGKELVVRNDGVGAVPDVGYPMAVQVDNNTVAVAYYITNSDGITHVEASLIQI